MIYGQQPHRNLTGKPRYPGLRLLIWAAALLAGVLLIFGIYSMVQLTALRVSADYYFPFLKAAQTAEDTAADQTLLLQNKLTLARALRRLMRENAMLTAEHAVVSDLKKENAELRLMMQLEKKGAFRPVFAEVLTRNPMTWQEQFTVDKGSRHGIRPGNLVVTAALPDPRGTPIMAVIGKVKAVTGHTAQVSTVLSEDFRLSVSLPETRTSGILEGAHRISDMCAVLKFLPLNAELAPGQLVCTNAFSGNSPPGLPVGRIISAGTAQEKSRNRLYQETGVRPFESPAEVRFVAVFVKDDK
ncbi:MAG: rod shape-determining protein MreC [Lentisphaeria bacterium]|nr:rod shape-determining protein MreC [Lentisphaeria bacterium]